MWSPPAARGDGTYHRVNLGQEASMAEEHKTAAWWEARWRARTREESSVDWHLAACRADDIAEMLELAAGQRILDIACGTATVERPTAQGLACWIATTGHARSPHRTA